MRVPRECITTIHGISCLEDSSVLFLPQGESLHAIKLYLALRLFETAVRLVLADVRAKLSDGIQDDSLAGIAFS